jgi:hypothetical protein
MENTYRLQKFNESVDVAGTAKLTSLSSSLSSSSSYHHHHHDHYIQMISKSDIININ